MAILIICYILFALGVYRGATKNGFKADATSLQKWKARTKIAALALIWPYLIGISTQATKVVRFF